MFSGVTFRKCKHEIVIRKELLLSVAIYNLEKFSLHLYSSMYNKTHVDTVYITYLFLISLQT